jgi:hypothetical protein
LPTGHEDSPFFLFLFMQCLPKELRIVLREVDDHEDMRAMAIKADKLWSLHNHQQHGVVASVDPGCSSSQPPATIAAVKSGPPARGGRSGSQRGKGSSRGGGVVTAATRPAAATPLAVETPDSMAWGLLRPLLLPLVVRRRRHPLRGRLQLAGKLASRGYLNAVTPVTWFMCWIRYPRGVSLSTLVQVTAYSHTGHHRRPLVRFWLAPQEQQFPVWVKRNLSFHLITKSLNGLFC